MALDLGLTTHQLLSALDGVTNDAVSRAQRLSDTLERGLRISADAAAGRTAAVGRRPYISARTGPEGLLASIPPPEVPRDWSALSVLRTLELDPQIAVVMVNESGASVYSASEAARTEFPEHDITVRGAVSIGRRLMDPLAELVKIDPKSIGVGQYQHDVDQKALKQRLDDVVVSCVNQVGVELNTASPELLSYVSGLGPRLANAIVEYRNRNGPFTSRDSLQKVPRLGPKAFE